MKSGPPLTVLMPTWKWLPLLSFFFVATIFDRAFGNPLAVEIGEKTTTLRAAKPVMASNSTQTEDDWIETKEDKPVILTGLVLAIAAACSSVLVVIILIFCIVCTIRCYWDRPIKEGPFGSAVPMGAAYVPVFVDRKMAQSAQMFFYQFQKQQMMAEEKEQKSHLSVDSDSCSEADVKDGHVPMISCPGLALKSGEDLEVRNPLFLEDVPTWNGSIATDDEERVTGARSDVTRSREHTDLEENGVGRHSAVSSSSLPPPPSPSSSPNPPPTPDLSTPSDQSTPSRLSDTDDPHITDVNRNLTQFVGDEEKMPVNNIKSEDRRPDSPSQFGGDSKA